MAASSKAKYCRKLGNCQKNGIIDGDFYLADLLSEDNNTLKENFCRTKKRPL